MHYDTLSEKIAAEKIERTARYDEYQALLTTAYRAGTVAGQNAVPKPMTIIEADPITGKPKLGARADKIMEGACGFAWVNIKPGNSSFARWLVKNNYASKSYYGGVDIWISDHNQSYERKLAHAREMARLIGDTLPKVKACASGRLD